MRYEYTEKAIYNQLVYFASLWDVDRAKTNAAEDADKIMALAEHNRVRFSTVKGAVDKYLDKCGHQWVQMDTLFSKLGFSKLIAV
jgi:DNA polymerase alpha subunit A